MVYTLSVALAVLPTIPAMAAKKQESTGCAVSPVKDYDATGFDETEFDLSGVFTDDDGDFFLDTAAQEIDPERIIIPMDQEVFATFIFEGAGYKSDFGYMYLDEVVEKDTDGAFLYKRVTTQNNIFDYEPYDPAEDEWFFRDASGDLIPNNQDTGYKRVPDTTSVYYAVYDEDESDFYFRDRTGRTIENYLGWDYVRTNNLQHPVFVKIDANGGTVLKPEARRGSTNRPSSEEALRTWDDGTGIPFIPHPDGTIDEKDMRKSLGEVDAGREIVFWLTSDRAFTTDADNRVFYTKKLWNPDDYNTGRNQNHNKTIDGVRCNYGGQDGMPFTPLVKRVPDGTEFEYGNHNNSNDEYFMRDQDGELIPNPDDSNNSYKRVSSSATIEWVLYDSADDEYFFRDENGLLIENVDDPCHAVYDSYWEDWDPTLAPSDQWFYKVYELGKAGGEKWAVDKNGWMKNTAVTSLEDNFGVVLDDTDTSTLVMKKGEKYEHVIVGAPADDPKQWILGWEDLVGAGDTDHNDVVFRIERKTGGEAELKSENAILASDTDDSVYYTGVKVEVWDVMPCGGKTQIHYSVSPDGGREGSWIDIGTGDWDVVKCATVNNNGSITLGQSVDDWFPGRSTPACTNNSLSPSPTTYRSKRIDLISQGLVGKELVWKATFTSEDDQCVPEVLNVKLQGTVSRHATFSRAQPVAQANMLYAGSYETPDVTDTDWAAEPELHGNVVATRLYEPAAPTAKKSAVSTSEIWNAGSALSGKTAAELGQRSIYYPDMTATFQSAETISLTKEGSKTYKGTLNNTPLSAGTLRIALSVDGYIEYFEDKFTTDLVGDNGGVGTINRHTGAFEVELYNAPEADAEVTANATYVYLQEGTGGLQEFKTSNSSITKDLLGLNHRYPSSKSDFDGDGDIDDTDKDLLIEWVRGIKTDGTAKLWPLGSVDHSTPALLTPPGKPAWLYGSQVPKEMKNSYKLWRGEEADDDNPDQETLQKRKTVLFVGARDGMLHAFDAGKFRWGNNPETSGIEEHRGYFLWDSGGNPQYGTGEELWAFVPGSLLSKLKNNLLKREDQAAVDASPTISDIYDGSDWKTVVLSGLGNGGDSVFCLDVTDPESPAFMWEFTHPDLFRSRSAPSVAAVGQIVDANGQPTWAAFFVSGEVDSDAYPKIFVIDVATGDPVALQDDSGSDVTYIELDADSSGIGGVASGQPAMVDADYNGFIDRLYIGTDKGNMYKVNLPDNPEGGGSAQVSHCVINTSFTDPAGASVPSGDRGHGIYGAPAVVVDDKNVVRVFFGTGDSPYADEDIDTGNTNYYFFGYKDESAKGACGAATLDWFYSLPAGERTWGSAFAAAGKIYFGTTTAETEDPCDGYGEVTATGSVYVMEPPDEENTDLTETTVDVGGNVNVGPVVYDQHILAKKPDASIKLAGPGQFNNEVFTGLGGGVIDPILWREINSFSEN